MQHVDLLNEKLLVNEFKFGFELEAIIENETKHSDATFAKVHSIIEKYFPDAAWPYSDGSVYPDSRGGADFEWPSPVLTFTPETIRKCITFLADLPKYGIYTNKTCGFHVHVSFPSMTQTDIRWIVFQIGLDEDIKNTILQFHEMEFFNDEYAKKGYLDGISRVVEDGDLSREEKIEQLRNWLTTDKYRNLRIHPQGTLEWRGPRKFLEKEDLTIIKDFFLLLWKFISWISRAAQNKVVAGFTREELFDGEIVSWDQQYKKLLADIAENPKIINKLSDEMTKKVLLKRPGLLKYYTKKLSSDLQDAFVGKLVSELLVGAFNSFDEKHQMEILLKHPGGVYRNRALRGLLNSTDFQKRVIDTCLERKDVNPIFLIYSDLDFTPEAMEYFCQRSMVLANELYDYLNPTNQQIVKKYQEK